MNGNSDNDDNNVNKRNTTISDHWMDFTIQQWKVRPRDVIRLKHPDHNQRRELDTKTATGNKSIKAYTI